MKTKDFIELLKKEDPTGESHIRLNGGFPSHVEFKAGYWDGPYAYIDDDNNYVVTTKGNKVDIVTYDIEEFVRDMYKKGDSNNWEKIKNKIKFELTYSIPEQRKERENGFLKTAREAWKEINEIETKLYNMSLEEMRENALKGWKWFQNKDVDKNERPNLHKFYTWKIYDENNKEQGSNLHMTEPVLLSDEWIKTDNNKKIGYYEWIYKN